MKRMNGQQKISLSVYNTVALAKIALLWHLILGHPLVVTTAMVAMEHAYRDFKK